MDFHNYKTMRPHDARGTSADYIGELLRQPAAEKEDFAWMLRALIEHGWLQHERPFYNVYPIAVELCRKLSLNMTWGDIALPTRYLLLRFAKGHEPFGLQSVLARAPSRTPTTSPALIHATRSRPLRALGQFEVSASIHASGKCYGWAYKALSPLAEQKVLESLDGEDDRGVLLAREEALGGIPEASQHAGFIIRMLAFIGLLSRGEDLITPAILAKDRQEYDSTSDEQKKRWLELRAAKRQGVGFDVGRQLERERLSSPHWRSPHLALFHTGPGRSTPTLKLRSGCVVIPRDLSSVPTGYMGLETECEAASCNNGSEVFFRPAIPKRLRFLVFRRDGYRCQLCGLTQQDGVKLEVDHKIPVARGGQTTPENLWTLCHPCNNGKSDSDLYATAKECRHESVL